MIDRFSRRLDQGPMLLDAALGTRLIAEGLDLATDDPCLWNQTRPAVVQAIHRRDVAAGAEAVFTNTFGANRVWLARFGAAASVNAINRQAVALARAAAGAERFVLGSIGPTAAADAATLREQADALLAAGADALVLETFRFESALIALGHLGRIQQPVLVGLFDWPEPFRATADRLVDAGAHVVGVNCSADFDLLRRWLDTMHAVGDLRFWLKPAATGPNSRTLTPADFARIAARLGALGRGLLGGCCGTSAAHLRAIRAEWRR